MTPARESVRLMAAATLALSVGFLPIFMSGALAVQLQADLGFGPAALGGSFAIFFGVAALASAPIGQLSERLGYRRSLQLASAVSALAVIGIAGLARSWAGLAALLAVAGLGVGFAQPGANLLIARAAPPGRRGLALGIKQSGIPVATLLGGFMVPVFATTVGWRWAYLAAAGVGVVTAAALPRTATVAGAGPRRQGPSPDGSRRPVGVLVLLAAGLTLGSAAATGSGAFAVATGVEQGLSEPGAALLFALASVGGIVVRVVAGHLVDRRRFHELRWAAAMLLAGSAGYLLLGGVGVRATYAGVVLAISIGWGWLGLFDAFLIRSFPDAVGSVTGRIWVGAFLGGGFGPLALGAVAERSGTSAAWYAMSGLALLAAAAMGAVAARQGRRASVHAPP